MMDYSVNEHYEKLTSKLKEERKKSKKQLLVYSGFRSLTFILVFVLGGLIFPKYPVAGLVVVMLCLALFGVSVRLFFKASYRIKFLDNLLSINENESKAVKGDFYNFHSGEENLDPEHHFAYDFDVFGRGSVYQYLNRTVTLVGRNKLAEKLTKLRNTQGEIYRMQEGLKELTPKLEWRQDLLATGMFTQIGEDDNENIYKWLREPTIFYHRKIFHVLRYGMPAITLGVLLLTIFGVLGYQLFAFLGLSQLFIASYHIRRVNKRHAQLSKEYEILKNYQRLINQIEAEKFDSDLLNNFKNKFLQEGKSASSSLLQLSRILNGFDTRLNLIVGFLLNATLMWDLQCVMRLEKWKLQYGKFVPDWINSVGEFDALCSFSNYAFNNPEYCYPVVNDCTVVNAKELGHPLLGKEVRIDNDFTIDETGKFIIVTGANMAGKSTFLRALGVNLVFAKAGIPVCAKSFEFKNLDLFSSMRTTDSLDKNESYFYAELKRLQAIVEDIKNGAQLFILLDEILKGTNSEDKAVGSRKFLEYLLKLGATGVIATHDLTVADYGEENKDLLKNQCFEIEIEGEKIYFDYKLRDGITQNMNAIILMKQMGIFEAE